MKRFVLILAALALCGCSGLRSGTLPTLGSLTAQLHSGGSPAALGQLVGVARADFQAALEEAQAGGDQPGVACHAKALAFLDKLTLPTIKISGIASLAEAARVQQRLLAQSRSDWVEVQDACAAVFPVATALQHVFDAAHFSP